MVVMMVTSTFASTLMAKAMTLVDGNSRLQVRPPLSLFLNPLMYMPKERVGKPVLLVATPPSLRFFFFRLLERARRVRRVS